MPASERFAVATHILALLSLQPDRKLTSACIAASITTNPVVVRRLIGELRRSGLVDVTPGPHGGATLRREPSAITLRDVYEAVEHGHVIALHPGTNSGCPVGKRIEHVLAGIVNGAEQALLQQLSTQRISDVVAHLRDL